jgi:cation diffusion facilitator family transporter
LNFSRPFAEPAKTTDKSFLHWQAVRAMNDSNGHRLERGVRATFLGIAANTLLAAGKILAGVTGHSQALIADGIESLADIVSSIVVWRALVVAEAPSDERHPYGHGKAEAIAAGIVAMMLLAAAIWIAVQSVHQIIVPHQSPAPYTLVVLIVVVVIKEILFRRVSRTAHAVESSALQGDAWHHRSDAITSLAAAIGIVVALLGGPGYERADDVAALLASFIIAWNGLRIARPALDDLMDAAAPEELRERITRAAASVREVSLIEKCVVRSHGHWYFVDLHIHVDPEMTVARSHALAHEVKKRLKAEFPRIQDVLVHVEPRREEPVPAGAQKSA